MPSCQSTNDELAYLVQNSAVSEGSIVITDNQTAGRGQRGNSWASGIGQNLTFSLFLKPHFLKPSQIFELNIAISLGVFDTLSRYVIDQNLKIKWPNDIFIDTKKMGGMLIENTLKSSQIASSIVGIGLNINQLNISQTATSLHEITHQKYDLEALLHQFCETIESNYLQLKKGNIEMLRRRYLQHLLGYQELTRFEANNEAFEGVVIGITEDGKLAVQQGHQLLFFGIKELKWLF